MDTSTLQFRRIKENNLKKIAHLLLDNEVGIISELKQVPRFASDPEFFHFSGTACNTGAFTEEKNFTSGGGASVFRDAALAKATGEAIERYSSAIFEIEKLPLYSFNNAPFKCIPPEDFSLYSDEQYQADDFKFVPFTRDTPVRWTEMTEMATGEKVYAPAAAVYMPYFYYQGTGDAPILQPISTGLACHASFEKAAISAISEVIERDAVMICWQRMIAMPQIRIETLSDFNYEIVKRLEANGSKVTILDITLDHGAPTVLSLLSGSNDSEKPGVIFAGAADPDPETAVRKSLDELPHSRRYCSRLMTYSPAFIPEFPEHKNVTGQAEHLHFYCDHNNRKYADFIYRSPGRKTFDEIPSLKGDNLNETLSNLLHAVHATGEKVYLKNLTTNDISTLGLTVVRAVIPGFQRLCMGYENRTLGGKRLWNLPEAMGLTALANGHIDNPAPHPYP